jgi:hypothetical protein
MGVTLTPTTSELAYIPPGTYKARFSGSEVVENLKFGDCIRWKFKLEDSEHEGVTLDTLSSKKFSEKSKSFEIATVLLGEAPKGELDLDTLTGAPCKIIVKTVKSERGDFSRVERVLPFEKKEKGEGD